MICFTNDLIDSNFLENGSFRSIMQFGSPSEAIRDMIQIVQGDAEIKKIKCVLLDDAVQYCSMNFDKQRLQQVVLNLLRNALKFSRSGAGNIELKVDFQHEMLQAGQKLRVSVKDLGIGISQEEVK